MKVIRRQAEPSVDPIDAFFKSIAVTVINMFLLIIKTFANQEYLQLYLKWKRLKFYKQLRQRIHQNILLALQTNLGYNDIGVPRNFFRGGVQQIQLRTERTGIWGRKPLSQGFWRQL